LITSVLSEGLRWAAAGLLLDFALSAVVVSLLARVLFGVGAVDPTTHAVVFAVLTAVSRPPVTCRPTAQCAPIRSLR
jgi:predicted TIM-barrel enzyme